MEINNPVFKLVVIVAALFALLFVAFKLSNYSSLTDSNRREAVPYVPETRIGKTTVEFSQAPEKFPTDIPIEAGAKFTQNYNSTAEDGRFQATRVFETTKTLAENYKIYEDYMKSAGWEIKATTNETNYKMLFGMKGDTALQVDIDHNRAYDQKTVAISYIELIKNQ